MLSVRNRLVFFHCMRGQVEKFKRIEKIKSIGTFDQVFKKQQQFRYVVPIISELFLFCLIPGPCLIFAFNTIKYLYEMA